MTANEARLQTNQTKQNAYQSELPWIFEQIKVKIQAGKTELRLGDEPVSWSMLKSTLIGLGYKINSQPGSPYIISWS